MSLAILGGSFDPIHHGHLRIATHCRERLRLDRVLLLPARVAPHKEEDAVTAWHHRMTMAGLACRGIEGIEASGLEGTRPGRSYTVDTLEHFRAAAGPDEALFFVMGTDSLADLPSWRQPERILELANLIVAARPGVERAVACAALGQDLRSRVTDAAELLDGRTAPAGSIFLADLPELDLSGSLIRRRVQEGADIGDLVPEAVAVYISRYLLYR